jgi:hypothetical protein
MMEELKSYLLLLFLLFGFGVTIVVVCALGQRLGVI